MKNSLKQQFMLLVGNLVGTIGHWYQAAHDGTVSFRIELVCCMAVGDA